LRLVVGGRERDFAVSGIYPDITNGGKTAKAAFSDDSGAVMWCVVNAVLTDPAQAGETAANYAARFPYAKVSGIKEFVLQTFGPTVEAVGKASYAAIAAAIAVSALVTLLFVRLLVAKDRADIAAMKALGFLDSEIRIQYLARTALVFIAGAACEWSWRNPGGVDSRGPARRLRGLVLRLREGPRRGAAPLPVLLAVPAAAAALLGASRIRRISISEYNKE
jgi:putative ABC transport system permease protein